MNRSAATVLAAFCLVIPGLAIWSLTIGTSDIGVAEVISALTDPQGDRLDIVLREVRLPRVLSALAVGAALAIAGAIMQAVTANPMADPGLLGVNAGAAFAVVLAIAAGGVSAAGVLVWVAFAGAGTAALIVYALGAAGRSGATPVKLVLAGVVVASFLTAVTTSILVVDAQTFDVVRLWTAGSLKGRQLDDVLQVIPYTAIAIFAALVFRGQFNSMALGAELAEAVGQNQALWRGIAALLVVALAGGAVALAGPIGFVGLVVPHIVRLGFGPDHRVLLPLAAMAGAGLTVLADTLPRAFWDQDIPVGIMLALLGAPVFIWLARRARTAG